MRVTIIRDDGVVGVDGVFRNVDLSSLDPDIHAVQWDGAAKRGHVEHKSPRRVEPITAYRARFQRFVDAWTAAAPPPGQETPTPTDQELVDVELDRGRALLSLVRLLAEERGWTEQQFRAAIRDKLASA